jgi:DNA-binding CsgD family transcriptional regulator
MNSSVFTREITQKNLSIVSFCLFSGWLLSFLFEGQVLYSIVEMAQIEGATLVKAAVLTVFIGLFSSGLLVKSQAAAKITMITATFVCISGSLIFYLPFSILWYIAIVPTAYFASLFLASWGFYFKINFNTEERFRTAAEILIFSNILMVVINVFTVSTSASIGLTAAILALAGALPFLFRLESNSNLKVANRINTGVLLQRISVISRPFILLCIFILIITINSGLMYQVVNPEFAHYKLLTAYYWAIPYILTILILRNLSARINKAYILYIAIAMTGLSYILFMWLDRSVTSYLLINTLMLGAFGVCDLFWWSVLGTYLDYHDNAAKVLGVGLSMNVLGVLIGSLIGNKVISLEDPQFSTSVTAVTIIFAVLIILPILNFQLAKHLKSQEFLVKFAELTKGEQDKTMVGFKKDKLLTEKEFEVVNLLLRGYTYKVIAESLFISENTIKYHVKNIYQKLNINNKMELIRIFGDNEELKQ